MVYGYLYNAVLGLVTLITMLFTVGNLDDAINAASPFQNAFTNTGSQGLNIFMTLILFLLILSGNITAVTTVSRETWAFARDGGLPFHHWMSRVRSPFLHHLLCLRSHLPTIGLKTLECPIKRRLRHNNPLPHPLSHQPRQQRRIQHHHLPQSRRVPRHLHDVHRLRPLGPNQGPRNATACTLQSRQVGHTGQHLRCSLFYAGDYLELFPCLAAC